MCSQWKTTTRFGVMACTYTCCSTQIPVAESNIQDSISLPTYLGRYGGECSGSEILGDHAVFSCFMWMS